MILILLILYIVHCYILLLTVGFILNFYGVQLNFKSVYINYKKVR